VRPIDNPLFVGAATICAVRSSRR